MIKRFDSFLIPIALTVAIAVLAIDDQSLWIDELGTWRLTVADSWDHWVRQLMTWPNSDSQIPLYHFYMKLWVDVFGADERTMRASNLPWVAVGFWALVSVPERIKRNSGLNYIFVILFVHPMVWYYTNEARPYAILFAGTCIAASGMLMRITEGAHPSELSNSNSRLIFGSTLMAATSAIGMIWVFSFIAPVVALVSRNWKLFYFDRVNTLVLFGCALIFGPVLYQYLDSFLRGVTATTLHKHTILNFAFAFYEVAGVAGIGPGRDDLRSNGFLALKEWVVVIGAYCILVGSLTIFGFRNRLHTDRKITVLILVGAIVPVLILFSLGYFKHWRVVGRHMFPLVFFFSYFLVGSFLKLRNASVSSVDNRKWLIPFVLVSLALLTSSLQIAFAPRHEREDYRSASALARVMLEKGGRVWWVADRYAPAYYQITTVSPLECRSSNRPVIVQFDNPSIESLVQCASPQLVVLARRDTFDVKNVVSDYVAKSGLTYVPGIRGFDVWTR